MTFQSSPSPAIYLENITKMFGSHAAVHNFSLTVPRGSFYGIVGPNGAGKTTAITIATGLLKPDAGSAFICGHPVWNGAAEADILAAKQSYGLLADNLEIFNRLSAPEYLHYLGQLRGMDAATIETRSADLLEALGLADAGGKLIVDFSAGMTKKILLAGALLHRPEVLILDEPFEAVDPVSGQVIREILRRFVSAGGTVVMSSHVMELVESLCDHVAIVNDGAVRAAGTTQEVAAGRPLVERFVELVGAANLTENSLNWLGEAHE